MVGLSRRDTLSHQHAGMPGHGGTSHQSRQAMVVVGQPPLKGGVPPTTHQRPAGNASTAVPARSCPTTVICHVGRRTVTVLPEGRWSVTVLPAWHRGMVPSLGRAKGDATGNRRQLRLTFLRPSGLVRFF